MEEWESIVCQMLCVITISQIPKDLREKLEDINGFCMRAGGRLRSRQVIAAIIATHSELKA